MPTIIKLLPSISLKLPSIIPELLSIIPELLSIRDIQSTIKLRLIIRTAYYNKFITKYKLQTVKFKSWSAKFKDTQPTIRKFLSLIFYIQ